MALDQLERFFSGWLFRSLGSFSSSDNVRRLLKLGKRFDSVATMVLSEALGLSLFLVLRGGIAWERWTNLRAPRSDQLSDTPRTERLKNRTDHHREELDDSLPETLKLLADVILWHQSTLLFFQIVKVIAAIFRARVRRAIAGLLPLARSPA